MLQHENMRPLVVDLDGTLLRTDTLWEGLFAMLGQKPWNIFLLPVWLLDGKLRLKRELAPYAESGADFFPINAQVLSILETVVSQGRDVFLATASYASVANAISRRFDCFSAVYASDEEVNLKGHVKAEFLIQRFGKGQFDYIGDSHADLPVWEAAGTAIVATSSSSVVAMARRVNSSCEELPSEGAGVKEYLHALRVHQWIKNILVFVPFLLAHLFTFDALRDSLLAFFSISLCASAIYVVNDLVDLTSDRKHPFKKNRPFASGRIPVQHSCFCFFGTIIPAFGLCSFLPPAFFFWLAGYLLLTIYYTLYLKRKLFLDVVVLACLYVARIVAGAAAIDIGISNWLLGFGIFIFLGLALIKRAGAVLLHTGKDPLPGRAYISADGPVLEIMATCSGFAATVIAALYVDSLQASQLYTRPYILWAVCPLLIYWYGRMILLMHRGYINDDPLEFAAKDRVSRYIFLSVLILLYVSM